MKVCSKKVMRLGAMVVCAAVWLVSVHVAFPAGYDSAMVPAMGDGMMGGGMMGGYGPRGPNNGNQERSSADLNSPAGRLYAQTCAGCHPLPNPAQHTADQWPGVVARMEQHMRQAGQALPGKDEITQIDKFLTQHANGVK